MKTVFSILIFFMFLHVSHAQKTRLEKYEFEAMARIILLSNDTINGTTIISKNYKWNNFKGSYIGKSVTFKKSGENKFKKYHPKELKGFQIQTSDSLWATFISTGTLEHFEFDNDWLFTGKLFLLKILEGDMSVYHYYHFTFFPAAEKGGPFWESGDVIKVLYKKGAPGIYHTEISEWKSRLLDFVKDCPALCQELKAVKYKWSFLQIAEYYNSKCEAGKM